MILYNLSILIVISVYTMRMWFLLRKQKQVSQNVTVAFLKLFFSTLLIFADVYYMTWKYKVATAPREILLSETFYSYCE